VIFSVFFSTLNGKFRAILIDEKFFLLSWVSRPNFFIDSILVTKLFN
jgi:hypothetical protein